VTNKSALHTLVSPGAGLTLLALGALAYLGVAVTEWRLGSIYHAGLELALLLSAGALVVGLTLLAGPAVMGFAR